MLNKKISNPSLHDNILRLSAFVMWSGQYYQPLPNIALYTNVGARKERILSVVETGRGRHSGTDLILSSLPCSCLGHLLIFYLMEKTKHILLN